MNIDIIAAAKADIEKAFAGLEHIVAELREKLTHYHDPAVSTALAKATDHIATAKQSVAVVTAPAEAPAAASLPAAAAAAPAADAAPAEGAAATVAAAADTAKAT